MTEKIREIVFLNCIFVCGACLCWWLHLQVKKAEHPPIVHTCIPSFISNQDKKMPIKSMIPRFVKSPSVFLIFSLQLILLTTSCTSIDSSSSLITISDTHRSRMEYENQYQQSVSPNYDCLLFDVDDTLYPLSSGLSGQVSKNILEYMVEKLGIDEKKASEMNPILYRNYGTSMSGLKAIGYEFNNDDYHSFVHGRLPYENLKPDLVLRSLLLSSPIRKVVFSNGDTAHVARVLSKLGLEDCFDGIITFESLNPESADLSPTFTPKNQIIDLIDESSALPETPLICKPFGNAFELAFKQANINPQRTIFFDDSVRNIQGGKQLGLTTVLVGTSSKSIGADFAVESIHNIKEALVDIWETNLKPETIIHPEVLALETAVRA